MWELTVEEYRKIIEGKIVFKKCTCSDGVEYYSVDTGKLLEPELAKSMPSYEVDVDCCDTCKGLGYLKAFEKC